MSIEGRIAIDVGFTDAHTTEGVSAVQRISLTATDSYTSGKVAVISGTCGTAHSTISLAPTTYRDASGNLVSFSSINRVAFQASRGCGVLADPVQLSAETFAVFSAAGVPDIEVEVAGTSGTASYTLVIYGT